MFFPVRLFYQIRILTEISLKYNIRSVSKWFGISVFDFTFQPKYYRKQKCSYKINRDGLYVLSLKK